jgi:hypothetical protein
MSEPFDSDNESYDSDNEPFVFDPEKETNIMVTRESLGLLIGREVDYHEWMLISSLRGTSSSGICEEGTEDFPMNAHGEKPYSYCHIDRDELKAYMVASKKYLGNKEWITLVSAMWTWWKYEWDAENKYTKTFNRGIGMPGSRSEQIYKEWLISRGIKLKTPADVIRDVLSEITIPPHYMGKY